MELLIAEPKRAKNIWKDHWRTPIRSMKELMETKSFRRGTTKVVV